MGLLISINGADFTPYHHVDSPTPAIELRRNLNAITPVHRRVEDPESFEKALKQSRVQRFNTTVEAIQKPSRYPTRARELMSSPVAVVSTTDQTESAKELVARKKIRHLPVVNSEEKIVGMLSDRDLLQTTAEQRVSDLMSRELIVAQLDTPLREIAKVLVRHRINALPIIDDDKKILGIITSTDLLVDLIERDDLNLWA